jgi:hypothetical protein
MRRRKFKYGFGESASAFTAYLISDGLDAGIAQTAFPDAWQAEYRYYRSKGAVPLDAWRFSEIASLDQTAAHIALDAGVPFSLLAQMRNAGKWMDEEAGRRVEEYAAPKAIRQGAPPLTTIQQALGLPVTGGAGDTVTQDAKTAAIARATSDRAAAQNSFDAFIPVLAKACQDYATLTGIPKQLAFDAIGSTRSMMNEQQNIIDVANSTITANGGTAVANPRKSVMTQDCGGSFVTPPPPVAVPPTNTTAPTCTGTVEQCQIPANAPYWWFPSGHTGAPTNVNVTPSITLPNGATVDKKWLALGGIGVAGILGLAMMNQKTGSRRRA